jgi:ADP-glucose type glycogen/starch synthase
MATSDKKPRLLIVTPEITYMPEGMGNLANYLRAKAGGLADVSAALVSSLYEQGADVHVALPNYRAMFSRNISRIIHKELDTYRSKLPEDRLHLAEDRCFYYRESVYGHAAENIRLALAFQREVINNIIPRVRPDLIHCNDWMTGLIPAVARRLGIPTLFTLHNIHTMKATLETMENMGIDAEPFWQNLYFQSPPSGYEASRTDNPVDLLTTGIFSSTFINTVSPTFLKEIVGNQHPFISQHIRHEVAAKTHSGRAVGVLNSPDPTFDPSTDSNLVTKFDVNSFVEGKRQNKLYLQRLLGLVEDPDAPMLFWPSRLDPVQKGCQLLADIFYDTIARYARNRLQIVIIANGPFQKNFRQIVYRHDLHRRVSVCDFEERLSHMGYAASDFILMPSSFEPCGLPQMIGPKYGSLPIAHDTGGIHDTVSHLRVGANKGNGFLFEVHDAAGLRWSIDQAIGFYKLPDKVKHAQIKRIMMEANASFNQDVTAGKYIKLYRMLLDR